MRLPSRHVTAHATPSATEPDAEGGDEREWMTSRQAAEYIGIAYGYLRQLVADGKIRSTKIGTGGRTSDRRIRRAWADAYLESRASGNPVPNRKRRAR